MKCDLLIQGALKDESSIWKKELDKVLKKYNFKIIENSNELRIFIPHCEEIIFSMLCKQQSIEFIYYGNNKHHLAGVFEIFWELEPYFENFYLEDSLEIWKKITLCQKKNIFPKICEHIEGSVKKLDRQLRSDDNELIGIAKLKEQTIDFLNHTISIQALNFGINNNVLKNVEIYFKNVDDYLFKDPLNIEITSSKFKKMVCEKTSKYLLSNLQKEKLGNKNIKSVGLFRLYNPLTKLFTFSMQSLSEIYGWIISKEIWIISEGKIIMKWIDNVWYYY
ncbi:MAG: hypothetical protein LBS28_02900 [Streptococcaceae bacterium]|jgi:hypothetical protein|nr:hypothetical protein [Streptococcaceae bacterium]